MENAAEATEQADLLMHLTEWPEFTRIDPEDLASQVTQRKVIDGRGTLDASRWREAGWSNRALGRP